MGGPEPALTDSSEKLMLMVGLRGILVVVVPNQSERRRLTTSPSCRTTPLTPRRVRCMWRPVS